jgi:hypothetical protein
MTHQISAAQAPEKPVPIEALVAFIDLLGFSDQVLSANTSGQLSELIEKVRLIRDYFDYQPEDQLTREAQAISQTEVLAFSDCVVVSIGQDSAATRDSGQFDTWMHDLHLMAHAQGAAAAAGNFFRGGIDKGLWYHDNAGILISPALVRAYQMEHAATYPVLAVSDSLYNFLVDHPGRSAYSDTLDPIPQMFRTFVTRNNKTIHYLNYIELLLGNLGWQYDADTVRAYRAAKSDKRDQIARDGLRKNVERFFRHHKIAVEHAHRAAKDDRVRAKYVFLRDYHNEIVKDHLPDRSNLSIALG